MNQNSIRNMVYNLCSYYSMEGLYTLLVRARSCTSSLLVLSSISWNTRGLLLPSPAVGWAEVGIFALGACWSSGDWTRCNFGKVADTCFRKSNPDVDSQKKSFGLKLKWGMVDVAHCNILELLNLHNRFQFSCLQCCPFFPNQPIRFCCLAHISLFFGFSRLFLSNFRILNFSFHSPRQRNRIITCWAVKYIFRSWIQDLVFFSAENLVFLQLICSFFAFCGDGYGIDLHFSSEWIEQES